MFLSLSCQTQKCWHLKDTGKGDCNGCSRHLNHSPEYSAQESYQYVASMLYSVTFPALSMGSLECLLVGIAGNIP